ncbi:hypothetical protein ABZY09_22855 [Streptomyces sp. NPDC002928]|uniref:hypothetical protein n=1 Tax=Streptomyces sp. NPDC002928 TaxID=3154440 RepID=UPI0033BBCABB
MSNEPADPAEPAAPRVAFGVSDGGASATAEPGFAGWVAHRAAGRDWFDGADPA